MLMESDEDFVLAKGSRKKNPNRVRAQTTSKQNDLNQRPYVAYGPTRELEILYQCEDFVVINKPFDVLVNSNTPGDMTVQVMLHNNGFAADRPNLYHEFYFVHRLDYATSGLLCVALTRRGAQAATFAFCSHAVEKEYIAIVRGHISLELVSSLRGIELNGDRLTIDVPIARDSSVSFPYMVATFDEDEKYIRRRTAKTELRITRKGEYEGQPATEVLLTPLTGRTHQLRVHLKYIGYRIVGDFTYSDKTDNSPIRMMLHNSVLKFHCDFTSVDCESRYPFCNDELWKPYDIDNVHE